MGVSFPDITSPSPALLQSSPITHPPTNTPDLPSHPSGLSHQTLHRPKKHSISSPAFHLKNKLVLLISGQGLVLVFRPPAMKQLLSVRGSSRPLMTPQRERLSFIPAPLKAVVHSTGHRNVRTFMCRRLVQCIWSL